MGILAQDPRLFRSEIQGLRGVAVLMVVLYHLGIDGFSLGYLGVDLFFVISGYLITQQLDSRKLSLSQFYVNRIARLAPLLALSVATTLLVATYLYLPSYQTTLLVGAFASILGWANLFFVSETSGYFSVDAAIHPFLHYWSIAVEVQFYLLYPFLYRALIRFGHGKYRSRVLLGALAICIALAEGTSAASESLSYYLTSSRLFEFLFGALGFLYRDSVCDVLKNKLFFFVLLIACAGLTFFAFESIYPGLYTVPFCILSIALLSDIGPSIKSRMLSSLALRKLGDLSYAIYLWHWPPIALFNYYGIKLGALEVICYLGLLLLWSSVTLTFIERPLRNRTVSPAGFYPVLLAAAAVLVTMNLHLKQEDHLKGFGHVITMGEKCLSVNEVAGVSEHCKLGDPDASVTVALWGDSFADTLYPVVDESLAARGLAGAAFVQHACPSIAGVKQVTLGRDFEINCWHHTEKVLRSLLKADEIKTVILANNYNWYFKLWDYSLDSSDNLGVLELEDSSSSLANQLLSTVDLLVERGKNVVLVGPHKPIDDFDKRIHQATSPADFYSIGNAVGSADADYLSFFELFKHYPQDRVCIVDLRKYLCRDGFCGAFDDQGDLLYSDQSHLTLMATQKIIRDDCFRQP